MPPFLELFFSDFFSFIYSGKSQGHHLFSGASLWFPIVRHTQNASLTTPYINRPFRVSLDEPEAQAELPEATAAGASADFPFQRSQILGRFVFSKLGLTNKKCFPLGIPSKPIKRGGVYPKKAREGAKATLALRVSTTGSSQWKPCLTKLWLDSSASGVEFTSTQPAKSKPKRTGGLWKRTRSSQGPLSTFVERRSLHLLDRDVFLAAFRKPALSTSIVERVSLRRA